MILCDAGVLLCLVDRTQPQHENYKNLVMRVNKPMVTTWACLTEVMYLSLHRGGWVMQKQLGEMILDGLLTIYEIQSSDYNRLFVLMEKYQDRPMDLADATLVLTAEKTGCYQIFTIDSDFLFYRIDNHISFEIIK